MKAKQPVSVNGIEFDALISEDRTYESTIPEYAVESGFSVSDAIILGNDTVDMTLYVTDTPVTWRSHAAQGRVQTVVKQLEDLYYSRALCTVVTTEKTWTNMAIESLKISKTADIGYAREIPITFRKIRTTSAKTATIPASYGKSGKSKAGAGTASTTNGSSGAGAGTGTAGSGTNSSSKSGDGKKSSILYSAGKAIGLIP